MDIVVELVGGICNARCVWCFTTYKCFDRMRHGMMDFKRFSHFIDLNKNFKFGIIPFSHGEALINPDFVRCCEYAISQDFHLAHLHTNLAMDLTDAHFDILTKFGGVVVNVGGGKPETHHSNTGTDLSKVLANLKNLWNKEPQKLEVKMVVNKRNIDEVGILRDRIQEISPKIPVSAFPLYFGPADSDDKDRRRFFEENLSTPDGEKMDKRIDCRDKVKLTKEGRVVVAPKLSRCYGLIPTVRWDGAVSICCRSRYHEAPVGDAFETPMKDILESSTYKKSVKLGLKRKYIEYCKYCS